MRLSRKRALESVCDDKARFSSFTRRTNLARIEIRRVRHVLTNALHARAAGCRAALQAAQVKSA